MTVQVWDHVDEVNVNPLYILGGGAHLRVFIAVILEWRRRINWVHKYVWMLGTPYTIMTSYHRVYRAPTILLTSEGSVGSSDSASSFTRVWCLYNLSGNCLEAELVRRLNRQQDKGLCIHKTHPDQAYAQRGGRDAGFKNFGCSKDECAAMSTIITNKIHLVEYLSEGKKVKLGTKRREQMRH